nr:MAG TPA: putative membrane protein [Caudoviricetes sp.]
MVPLRAYNEICPFGLTTILSMLRLYNQSVDTR